MSDPGGPDLPAEHKGRENGDSSTPGEGGMGGAGGGRAMARGGGGPGRERR